MSYFDEKITVDVAILDLSKAFDTVPHDTLLHDISHYGGISIAGSATSLHLATRES